MQPRRQMNTIMAPYFCGAFYPPGSYWLDGMEFDEIIYPQGCSGEDQVSRIGSVGWATKIKARKDGLNVSLAGDCITGLGHIAADLAKHPDLEIMWLDSHADMHDWHTTQTGHIGGMALGMMLGRGNEAICQEIGILSVTHNDVHLYGGWHLDGKEQELIEQTENLYHWADRMPDRKNQQSDRPIHLHLDMDYMNGAFVPAVHYPCPTPIYPRDMYRCLEHLLRECDIVGISVSGWNPFVGNVAATRTQKVFENLMWTIDKTLDQNASPETGLSPCPNDPCQGPKQGPTGDATGGPPA